MQLLVSQLLLVSLLPQIQAAETILGAYIFHRHGDRTTKSYPPTSLTPLGYQQVYQSGEFYRTRYISNGSTQIFGIGTDVVQNSQLSVQTAVDTVLQNSATGFLQGLYPPVGATLGSQTLANGTSVEEPLGGYQLIPVSVLASESSIANSGDSQWLEGNSGCQNAIVSSNEYFFTSDYSDLISSTGAFYQSILPVINTTFTSATDTYKNAYAIWDYIQVSMIHNQTIPSSSLLTPDVVTQVSTLANHHEFELAYNATDPIRAVAGMTLAAQIIQQLNSTLAAPYTPLLSIQFGEYASFLSYFGLASLPSVSVNFTGITNFASSMTFELVTNATVTATSYPPLSEISVRFLFSNGSAAENPLTPYPLFGMDTLELPWTTFLNEMESFAIGNQTAWCDACGATSTACSATASSPTPTPSATSAPSSKGMSAAVGGVIGAMVTLGVILGLEALLLLVAGLRVVKNGTGGAGVELGNLGGRKQ